MLAKTGCVDKILRDPKTGEYELVLGVEAGEWEPRDLALSRFKDKIDGYARFALDGEMRQRYPESAGKPVVITVVSVDVVPPFFEKWIAAIVRVFAEEGLTVSTVRVQVDDSAAPPPAA